MNSNYYDEPEGFDAFGKMCATNRIAGAIGLAWATVDSVAITKPKGYIPTLARYIVVTAPFIGAASAFTLATFAATNFRGKDDKVNYVIGGYCAGAVIGAARRSFYIGGMFGTIFAIAGMVKKTSKQEGWDFFHDSKIMHGYGSLIGANHDLTVMAERKKNYTTQLDK